MVTGEPGSGKTTLGVRLSSTLRVPFLSRDHIRGGLLATSGLWTNQLHAPPSRANAIDAFVDVAETMALSNVSFVIEFVVTPRRLEAFQRLRAAADVVVLLTLSQDSTQRAELRDRGDELLNRPEVLAALGHHSIEGYLGDPERAAVRDSMLKDFDLPTLRVTTDDAYDPPFDQIAEWIIDRTRT